MSRSRLSVVVAAVSALVLCTASTALALPGDVDQTFGTFGHATFDFPNTDFATSIDRQSTGAIVVAGDDGVDRFQVARFTAEGQPDLAFGAGGSRRVQIPGATGVGAWDVAIQANDRIVVVGYMFAATGFDKMVVARFRAGGAVDTSFGTGGVRKIGFSQGDAYGFGVAVQSDGRIVLAGYVDPAGPPSKVAVVRLRPDGTLNPTFGNGGRRIVRIPDGTLGYGWANKILVTPKGRLVVAGTNLRSGDDRTMAMRLLPGGRLDRSFGGDGVVTVNAWPGESDEASGLAVSGGRILLAVRSQASGQAYAVRLTGSGARDVTFSGDGVASTPIAGFRSYDVAVQPGGLVLVSDWGSGKLMRFTAGGIVDAGFGTAGVTSDPAGPAAAFGIELQTGRILLVGVTATDVTVVSRFLGS